MLPDFKAFLRSRVWFDKFYWASFCSIHREHNPKCNMCRAGSWAGNWNPDWNKPR